MQGANQTLKRSAALQLLSAHMRENVVRLGKSWCCQIRGIPQVGFSEATPVRVATPLDMFQGHAVLLSDVDSHGGCMQSQAESK